MKERTIIRVHPEMQGCGMDFNTERDSRVQMREGDTIITRKSLKLREVRDQGPRKERRWRRGKET